MCNATRYLFYLSLTTDSIVDFPDRTRQASFKAVFPPTYLILPNDTYLMSPKAATADWIKQELSFDDKIKVAGFDADGLLRGK